METPLHILVRIWESLSSELRGFDYRQTSLVRDLKGSLATTEELLLLLLQHSDHSLRAKNRDGLTFSQLVKSKQLF